jgi:hypothetical protein
VHFSGYSFSPSEEQSKCDDGMKGDIRWCQIQRNLSKKHSLQKQIPFWEVLRLASIPSCQPTRWPDEQRSSLIASDGVPELTLIFSGWGGYNVFTVWEWDAHVGLGPANYCRATCKRREPNVEMRGQRGRLPLRRTIGQSHTVLVEESDVSPFARIISQSSTKCDSDWMRTKIT